MSRTIPALVAAWRRWRYTLDCYITLAQEARNR